MQKGDRKTMEKQDRVRNTRSLTDLLRRRRDPSGDLPFDPDAEPPMEDGEPTGE